MSERGIVGRCLLLFAHACRCSPCFAGYAAAINQNQSVNDVIEVNQSPVIGNEAIPPKRESYRDQRSFELALRKWNNDQAALSVSSEFFRNPYGKKACYEVGQNFLISFRLFPISFEASREKKKKA